MLPEPLEFFVCGLWFKNTTFALLDVYDCKERESRERKWVYQKRGPLQKRIEFKYAWGPLKPPFLIKLRLQQKQRERDARLEKGRYKTI